MFSVVIPAYNCERTIYDSLESVMKQTRKDLIEEIIIINDGSTDNTERIVKDYIKEHKGQTFVYLTQKNQGVSFTRNRAIKMARAEWIALLDSDDVWLSNKLERQYEYIQNVSGICFLGSTYPFRILIRKQRRGLHKLTAKEICIRSMPSTPSVVFAKSAGEELGLFKEGMKYAEDINFFQKFLLKNSYYILAEPLVQISIGKKYFAESGLSSNLALMNRGRAQNTKELYEMGQISYSFFVFIRLLNMLKYFRRKILWKIANVKRKKEREENNKFSVIFPVHNCQNTICDVLDSVRFQTKADLIQEIIIINYGSADETEKEIFNYIKMYPNMNIKYMRQENKGISYARSVGIKHAKGKWIALLEAGDKWDLDKLEYQYEILTEVKKGRK